MTRTARLPEGAPEEETTMTILERSRQILLSPRSAWPAIAERGDSARQVMIGHVAPLAALSALAGFIGYSLIGVGAFGFSARVPLLAGLAQMVVAFVLALVMVGLLAWLAQWLAPRFGGVADMGQSVRLAGYAATAGLLGGLFQILPMLAVLGLLAGLYSLYLLYTGLPVLMKNRPEDTLKYTAVLVVAMVVCGLVLGMLGSALMPGPAGGFGTLGKSGGRGASDISIETPMGKIDIKRDEVQAWSQRAEAAAQKMAKAQATGDAQAGAQALQQSAEAAVGAITSMLGGGSQDPNAGQPSATPEQLVAVLPDSLAELPRHSLRQNRSPVMGGAEAHAQYGSQRQHRLQVTLMHHRLLGQGVRFLPEEKSEDPDRITHKRLDKTSGWFIDEQYARDGSNARLKVIMPNGAQVELKGQGMDRAAVQAALDSLPLAQMAKW